MFLAMFGSLDLIWRALSKEARLCSKMDPDQLETLMAP